MPPFVRRALCSLGGPGAAAAAAAAAGGGAALPTPPAPSMGSPAAASGAIECGRSNAASSRCASPARHSTTSAASGEGDPGPAVASLKRQRKERPHLGWEE